MTSEVTEGRQVLEFDARWSVVVWDLAPEHKGSMECAFSSLPLKLVNKRDGTQISRSRSVKAVDVTGVRNRDGVPDLLLIAEFKDFAHPSIPPAQRAARAAQAVTNELMHDLIAKVVDSLAGRTFAHPANDTRGPQAALWRRAIADPHIPLLVLLCIEMPRTQIVALSAWQTELKRRLAWLGPTARVLFTSSATPFTRSGITYRVP